MKCINLVAVIVALLLFANVAECRKGGGGSRFGGSRRASSGRRASSSSVSRRRFSSHKPGFFDKGGIKTFGKIALATYIARKMTPSVGFSPYSGYDYNRRANFCHHCMSIEGSDPECENGTEQVAKCSTNRDNPYCSIEYGITNKNQTYIRRSCNSKLCRSCVTSLVKLTKNYSSECFPIQCQMCNWQNCNNRLVEEVFGDDWQGCRRDENTNSTKFSKLETCAAPSSKSYRALLAIILLCLSSQHFT